MNARTALSLVAFTVCMGSVWAVLAQRQQLATLRAERSPLTTPPAATGEDYSAFVANQSNGSPVTSSGDAISQELLRLRSEVTRLSGRKRELSGVVKENERLRVQLDSSRTNAQVGSRLPAGYIRKAQAGMVGYSTPENTFQTFLWAVRNHDLTNFLRSLTPAAAQRLQSRFQDPSQTEAFFKEMDAMPGLAIQNRKNLLDGSAQFEVEVVPGMPKEPMQLQLINGEWKLDLP